MKFLMMTFISNQDIFQKLLQIEKIMTEQQAQIDDLAAQLAKAKTEIIAKIDDLQAQIDAGEPVDLTALKAAVQGIDDLNPDAIEDPEEG